jgi:hypothetical protein
MVNNNERRPSAGCATGSTRSKRPSTERASSPLKDDAAFSDAKSTRWPPSISVTEFIVSRQVAPAVVPTRLDLDRSQATGRPSNRRERIAWKHERP